MKQTKWALMILVAFFVGCATSSVVSQLLVPEVHAGTNPPRWEQLCVIETRVDAINERAKAMGEAGWELIGVTDAGGGLACYKRPLDLPSTPPAM